MRIPIENAAAIGKVVRASRTAQRIRQDDTAESIGVSEHFLGKIKRGGDTVQWGKLFQVLEGLGIRVLVDVPESVAPIYVIKPSTRTRHQTAGLCVHRLIRHPSAPCRKWQGSGASNMKPIGWPALRAFRSVRIFG